MKKRVFIVDDIETNIQILHSILLKSGYDIDYARNGKDALEKAVTFKPDLILLDVMMPVMDGYEVCKKLKNTPECADIPVIFLTARNETESIVKGFKAGAVDYLTKPFNATELIIRVENHIKFRDSKKELINLNESKDRFFRIIAHDIRSPLVGCQNLIKLLNEDYDKLNDDDRKSNLHLIQQSSNHLSGLLDNLILWSRGQSGNYEFNPERFNIMDVVHNSLDLLQFNASYKKISLESDIPKELVVRADKNMLYTIIRNLLSNAIKFTQEGGKVTLKTLDERGFFSISVEDNGIGMSEDTIKSLFSQGEQHRRSGTNDEPGSGLGLRLCKTLVEKHKGEIRVESEKDKGSRFIVILPSES